MRSVCAFKREASKNHQRRDKLFTIRNFNWLTAGVEIGKKCKSNTCTLYILLKGKGLCMIYIWEHFFFALLCFHQGCFFRKNFKLLRKYQMSLFFQILAHGVDCTSRLLGKKIPSERSESISDHWWKNEFIAEFINISDVFISSSFLMWTIQNDIEAKLVWKWALN